MIFVFFDNSGRVETAYDDDTVSVLPDGAYEISNDQWPVRFDLCLVDGVIVIDPPVPVSLPALPDVNGFVDNIKTALGGIVALNALMRLYPAFHPALTGHVWEDVKALVVDANSTTAITTEQYSAFQTAFDANNIPVTLP